MSFAPGQAQRTRDLRVPALTTCGVPGCGLRPYPGYVVLPVASLRHCVIAPFRHPGEGRDPGCHGLGLVPSFQRKLEPILMFGRLSRPKEQQRSAVPQQQVASTASLPLPGPNAQRSGVRRRADQWFASSAFSPQPHSALHSLRSPVGEGLKGRARAHCKATEAQPPQALNFPSSPNHPRPP